MTTAELDRADRVGSHHAVTVGHLLTRCRQALGLAIMLRRPEALASIPAGDLSDVLGKQLTRLWRVIATAESGDDLELLAKRAECFDQETFLDLQGDAFGDLETVVRDLRAVYTDYQGVRLAERIAHATDADARRDLAHQIIGLGTAGVADFLRTVSPVDLVSPTDPVPWCIPNYAALGDVTLLCGDAGSGKTWTADYWAIERALRGDSVLIWQAEQPERLVSVRVHKLLGGAGIAPEAVASLRYLVQPDADLSTPEGLAALRALIERDRPALVIFDSLVRIMGKSNPDKAEEVSAFFGRVLVPIARDYGCAVLVLHHLRKPSGSDDSGSLQHKVRGSSDLPAAVGSVLVLDRNGEHRTLYQTKCRWQPEQPPVGIQIEDVDHGVRVSLTGASVDTESTVYNMIADAGRAGLLRQEVVAQLEDAGFRDPERLATKHLGRLKARGRIVGKGAGPKGTRYWVRDLAPPDAREGAEVIDLQTRKGREYGTNTERNTERSE